MRSISTLAILIASALNAAGITADSSRGAVLFQSLACIECHSVNGKGGSQAPDLGRRIDRNFTPASLAATMWNHAPRMWTAMRDRKVEAGDLSDQAAADLFAYFYSARFFDHPGDAARGKRLFSSEHCADCHGLTDAKIPEAKPVSQWQSLNEPIALVDAMWNHVSGMRQEFSKRHLAWPVLNAQDLEDMLVYLRNLPSMRNAPAVVEISAGSRGQELFQSKGCASCHTGRHSLDQDLKAKTLTEIAAALWNHEPRIPSAPAITLDEMREIASDLWARQFFKDEGSAAAGAHVFKDKLCAVCHNNASSGAPSLTGPGRAFTAAAMVSALWHHGPAMLDQMHARHIPWPRFDGRDMANLIAYLNAGSEARHGAEK